MLQPLLEKIALLAAAGVDWIQLREKDLSGKQSASLAKQALIRVGKQKSSAEAATHILMNDRLDVAIAERVGGVHLGEDSLRTADVSRLLQAPHFTPGAQRDFFVGVSTHSLEAARSAEAAGANYVFFGPIFATPSKAAYGAPQGLAQLAEVCSAITIPVLAIGGTTIENASTCFSAGAAGIAAIRLFQDAADPAATVRALHGQMF